MEVYVTAGVPVVWGVVVRVSSCSGYNDYSFVCWFPFAFLFFLGMVLSGERLSSCCTLSSGQSGHKYEEETYRTNIQDVHIILSCTGYHISAVDIRRRTQHTVGRRI